MMEPVLALFLKVFFYVLWGLVWGSFAGVLAYRLPRGQSVVSPPRSYCPTCHTTLKPLDLIPVVSHLCLRGRCRYCGKPIPIRALAIELGAGIIWGYIGWKFPFPLSVGLGFLFLAMWVTVFTDLEFGIIPDRITLPMLAALLVLTHQQESWPHIFQDLGFGAGIPFVLALFGGMGWGDVKLFGILALAFGWVGGIRILVWASVFAVIHYVLMGRSREIRFGPFIFLAAFTLLCTLGTR